MDNSAKVIEVDINDVLPNRNQPRLILNEEDDLSLTDSVKQYGVLQPIIVRTIGDKYEIIAGERRYRASVLAGKETVPVIVKNMTDKESAEIALIENVQRKELTPIEEALSYKNILDLGYLTQEQLAEKIGKSQPAIANKIRLLNLSDEVQDALLENQISERHARSLLKIKNKKQQKEMLDRIINERLTVRKTDLEIEKLIPIENDDQSEGSSLIIEREKGENNMNSNEYNNMPQFTSFTAQEPQTNVINNPVSEPKEESTFNVPQFDIFANAQPTAAEPVREEQAPQFNIFAGTEVTPVESTQTVEEPKVENTFNIPQFDIFTNAQPAAAEPVAPQVQEEQPVPQFDIFANAKPAAVEPAREEQAPQFNIFAEQTPKVEESNTSSTSVEEPKVENTFNIPQFDIFTNAKPASPAEPVEAVVPQVQEEQPVPQFDIFANAQPGAAEPVREEQAPKDESNVYSAPIEPVAPVENILNTAPVQDSVEPIQPEVKPEPIIVTDYNKQYDPIMPNTQPVTAEPVAFKEVIAAIRECADKIESYGYKIDVDEFDLTNIYQAIFKIEKM